MTIQQPYVTVAMIAPMSVQWIFSLLLIKGYTVLLGICFVIVVVCNVVLAFVCLGVCRGRDRLLLLIEGKDDVIEGLTKANREKSKTIAEYESLIAKSESLMEEYDAAFKPIAELMGKYPNETKG